MLVASIDFETASVVDLRKSGVSRYARDPSTHAMCMAWANGTGAPELWLPGDPCPAPLVDLIAAGGMLAAWNAGFERAIWTHIMTPRFGWPEVADTQWQCSMAQGLYAGLPASLEMAAPALGLPAESHKDAGGRQLMRLFMKPCGYDPEDGTPLWAKDDPRRAGDLVDYYAYCLQDVITEQAIAAHLPPLPPRERAIWLLDQTMNDRGMTVDMDLVLRMHTIAADARQALNLRINQLTNGRVENIRARADFLRYIVDNLDVLDLIDKPALLDESQARWRTDSAKRDVLVELRRVVPDHVRDVIDVWLDGARTSPAKLDALIRSTDADDQLRNSLRYYGAGRTGRWAGSGPQPQNLPRPNIKLVSRALDLIEAGADAQTLDELCEDSTLSVIASCLRGCFTAPSGELLVCADLAQIEARVIAWLAGQQDVLAVFRSGEDIYKFTAASIGSNNRQLGKTCRLALSYGMGPDRFVTTAKGYGIGLSLEQAIRLVCAYREASPDIVGFWWDLDGAMRACLEDPDSTEWVEAGTSGYVAFRQAPGAGVEMHLPSGRSLLYRNLRLQPRTIFEDGKAVGEDPDRTEIVYDGVNPRTRKWGPIRTYGAKTAEQATQATARDVMAEGMLALDKRGHRLVLTVHDEIIGTAAKAQAPAMLAEMLAVMRRPVPWAPGLPVDAEGFTARRYRK